MSIKEEKIHGFSALMHLAERICGVKHKRFLLAPRGVALVNVLLVLMVNEHKYNRDWMAAHKK